MQISRLPDTPKSLVFDIDLTLYDSRAYHASQRQVLIARLAASLGTSVQETEATLQTIRDDFARHHAGRQLSMGNALRSLGVSLATSSQWREEIFQPENYRRPDRALDHALAELSATFCLAGPNLPSSRSRWSQRTMKSLCTR
jgi:hypothetical protein